MKFHSLKTLFRRPLRGRRTEKKGGRWCVANEFERLEQRIALAADVAIFEVPRSVRGEGWVSVLVERGGGDVDIAIAQESEIGGDVAIDLLDGNGKRYIEGFSNKFDVLSVFEGSSRVVNDVRWSDFPYTDSNRNAMYFPLPIEYLDVDSTIEGVLAVGDRSFDFIGRVEDGYFEFNDQQGSVPAGRIEVELVYTPVSGSFGGGGTGGGAGGGGGTGTGTGTGTGVGSVVSEFAGLVFRDADLAGKFQISAGATPMDVRIRSIDVDPFINADTTRRVFTDLLPSRAVTVSGKTELQFQLFDLDGLTYAPGTLAGRVEVQFPATGRNELNFYADTLVPDQNNYVRVSFAAADQAEAEPTPEYVIEGNILDDDTDIDPGNTSYLLEGFLSLDTGVLHLVSDSVYSSSFGISRTQGGAAISGRVLEAAAGFSQPLDSPERLRGSADIRIAPGGTFIGGLNVNLSAENSTVWVQNPVVASSGTASSGTVSFGATSVLIDAPVRAADAFVVSNIERDGSVVRAAANPEVVEINARISSPRFRFDLSADDGGERSRLLVGQAGVLYDSAAWADIEQGVAADAWADEVVVNIDSGDFFLAGTAAATLLNVSSSSSADRPLGAGFEIATRSPLAGVSVGRVIGQTAVLNLGNDTHGPSYNSLVESVVSLDTEVDTLRVAASSRPGDPLDEPFPYRITIRERDDLVVDAIARSSGAMELEVGGTLDLRAALRSQDDVVVRAGGAFAVAAPIVTAFGKISLTAPEVSVGDKVQILDRLQDERVVDIELVATEGQLRLDDSVIAINRVVLSAQGNRGTIQGNSTVFGDLIEASAVGDIELRTEANAIAATAGGSISLAEETAAVFEVFRSKNVSLFVGGTDTLLDQDGAQAVSPALYADVYGTDTLYVSAPNGSVDILHHDSETLTVGEIGGGVNALAAGSVVIASDTASLISVNDAPYATSSAIEVRSVTTAPLNEEDTVYQPGIPGVFGTYIDTRLSYAPDGKIAGLAGLEADGIRVGDRILVRDGLSDGSKRVNGVYAVVGKQYQSGSTVRLRLIRVSALDETEEWEGRRYIRVTDGANRGKVYVTNGFGSASPGAPASAPLIVRPVVSRAGYFVARATTTSPLGRDVVTYETDASTEEIRATVNGNIALSSELFNQVILAQGDLVLVRDGVVSDGTGEVFPRSPGIYQVQDAGDAGRPWVLSRYISAQQSAAGNAQTVYAALVAVDEGSLRTSKTGQMYEVVYDGMHHADLIVAEMENYRDRINFSNPSATPFNSATQFRTDIGSQRPDGIVRYAVTSEAGTNRSPGSLGKILTLAQNNTAKDGRVERRQSFDAKQHAFEVVVGAGVERIELQQALPAIRSKMVLDGRNAAGERVVLDGSQVTTSRDGATIRTSLLLNEMGPLRPGQLKTARKLIRDVNQGSLTEAYGFEFLAGSDGSVVSGFAVGGFRSGGGVRVVGASEILLEDLVIGRDSEGDLLANKNGVLVQSQAGQGMGSTGWGTTILGTEISGSVLAAVRLDTGTDGVRVVDSHVHNNGVGVEVDSNTGRHLIGVGPILPRQPIAGMRLTKVAPSASGKLRVAVRQSATQSGEAVDFFNAGHQFYDSTTGRLWEIEGKELDSADPNKYVFTLSVSDSAMGSTEEVLVQAGYFVQTAALSERIVLPAGMMKHRDDLFLGQEVRGATSGVFAAGTLVKSLMYNEDGSTTVGLTRPILVTSTVAVLFGPATGETVGRNRIELNDDGVVLVSGSSRVVGNDISRSTYDGVLITGVAADGRHEIGGANTGSSPFANNAIYANNYAGVRVGEDFFRSLADGEVVEATKDRIKVSGNYFGTDKAGTNGAPNGPDGNIFFTNEQAQRALVDGAGSTAIYLPGLSSDDSPQRDRDREGNLHFTGDPASVLPGGGGFDGGDDDGWWNNLPTLR